MTPRLTRLGLVDGTRFEALCGYPLAAGPGVMPLFDPAGPDAELVAAGGWLIEPGVSAGRFPTGGMAGAQDPSPWCWMESAADAMSTLLHLRQQLDITLPDGRTALLRFYDPRVLAALAAVLDREQWASFCGPVRRWHLELDGQTLALEGPDAAPQ